METATLRPSHFPDADALIELMQALFDKPDVGTFLRRAKELAARLVKADRVSVFVLARDRRELWSVVADGEEMIRVPEGKGIVGEVMRTGAALNVADAASDQRFYAQVDKHTGYETKSVLCVPMRGREGRILGAIEALNRDGATSFNEHDERMLVLLGIQAGLAVEHIEMAEDSASSCAQLRLFLDIQKNINVSMDVEQILEAILSRLIVAVRGTSGVIQTITRNGIVGYHGFEPGKGYRYWEECDRRTWPRHLSALRAALESMPAAAAEAGFCRTEHLVLAHLGRPSERRGYIAVHLDPAAARLFNPESLEWVKVIAEQTVSLLDKQEAAEENRRTEKQALLGSMLSTIVHDMKNPLSGITGFAQLIKRRVQDTKVHEFCDIILDSLTRVERMNSELLLFVRGESLELDRSVFALHDFLQPLVNTMAVACQRSNISIELECPPDARINGDRDRLHRVFANLLANAREAIEKDGCIHVTVASQDDRVTVTIQDTGKGIPGRILEHVFEPFVSYGKKNGTGLGMSIAKGIIEKHDGSIQVKSVLGKGTTVVVTLPKSLPDDN